MDRDVQRAIQSEFLFVQINLHELRLGPEQPFAPERQPVIDSLADHQNQVGLPERRVNSMIQRGVGISHDERMIVRDCAARHCDRVQR